MNCETRENDLDVSDTFAEEYRSQDPNDLYKGI